MNAEDTLRGMISYLKEALSELSEMRNAEAAEKIFVRGQIVAFTECLDLIRRWDGAKANGLGKAGKPAAEDPPREAR